MALATIRRTRGPRAHVLHKQLVNELEKVTKKLSKAGPGGLREANCSISELLEKYNEERDTAITRDMLYNINVWLDPD